MKAKRDDSAVQDCLAKLETAAQELLEGNKNSGAVMPLIIDAVRARCTVGEISTAFQNKWGAYSPRI